MDALNIPYAYIKYHMLEWSLLYVLAKHTYLNMRMLESNEQ